MYGGKSKKSYTIAMIIIKKDVQGFCGTFIYRNVGKVTYLLGTGYGKM